jgi:hypothetical protein
MVDPLSLAGLTLAICDELLKLGERTAELVRDIRAFDEVCCIASSVFATPGTDSLSDRIALNCTTKSTMRGTGPLY